MRPIGLFWIASLTATGWRRLFANGSNRLARGWRRRVRAAANLKSDAEFVNDVAS